MRFTAIALLASVGLASAQTSTTTVIAATVTCAAQNILDACIATIQTEIDKCVGNDWICLCDNYTNLLTCYNNCPDDPTKASVQNQVTQYCVAAEPLKSASRASAKTATTTIKATGSADAKATSESGGKTGSASKSRSATTGFGSGTATKDSGSDAENTGAAAAVVVPVGGALAGLLAVVGLL